MSKKNIFIGIDPSGDEDTNEVVIMEYTLVNGAIVPMRAVSIDQFSELELKQKYQKDIEMLATHLTRLAKPKHHSEQFEPTAHNQSKYTFVAKKLALSWEAWKSLTSQEQDELVAEVKKCFKKGYKDDDKEGSFQLE